LEDETGKALEAKIFRFACCSIALYRQNHIAKAKSLSLGKVDFLLY
jgi:hypothetical protein